jgi:hypothetical protein
LIDTSLLRESAPEVHSRVVARSLSAATLFAACQIPLDHHKKAQGTIGRQQKKAGTSSGDEIPARRFSEADTACA